VGKKPAQRSKRTVPRRKQRAPTIAEVIEGHGTVAQFARDLSRITGEEVSWARVNAWKLRNNIPKAMVLHVHKLTGIPLTELL